MGQIGWLMGIITPAFPAMKGGGEEEARGSSNGERSVVVVRCGCGELLAGGGEKGEREMALLPPLFVL